MEIYTSLNVHVCNKVIRVPKYHPAPRCRLHPTFTPALEAYNRRTACKTAASLKEPGLQSANQLSDLKAWLAECHDVNQSQIKLEVSAGLYSSIEDFRVTQNVQAGEVNSREQLKLHYQNRS